MSSSRLAVLLSVACLLGAARFAAAQSVTVPTFVVQSGYPQVATGVDLAQGADGAVLFAWDELRAGMGYSVGRARRSPAGIALPLGPQMTGCCTARPPYVRVAAYGGGGYARLAFSGYSQTFTAISWQLDPLATELADSAYIVNPTVGGARTDEAHGGAVATYGDDAFYVLWDDVTGNVVGRRLIGYPVVGGPAFVAGASNAQPYVAIAEIAGHGLVAGWGSVSGAAPHATGVLSDRQGTFGAPFTLSADTVLRRVVASPRGDRFALVGTRPAGSDAPTAVWGRYFDPSGTPLGPDFAIHTAGGGAVVDPDAAFDAAGNLYVVWTEGGTALRVVGVAADGTPSGPPVTLGGGAGVGGVRTIRLADPELQTTGRFMNAWTSDGGAVVDANVASLCTPGTSTCGDGVRAPFCEFCDDGAANSDSAPDACRTDCRPARCGDGIVDAGEGCDDGNVQDCDGCSATCTPEPAVGCGNGLAIPACGEPCDDGNTADGDGCSATCQHEFVRGGGASSSDCIIAWSVDNPANAPRYAKTGTINASQACTDNDPRCDFDGGVVGSCTFKLHVCAAVSTLPACAPPERLASWRLVKPSAQDAAKHPDAAQVVDALNATVPGAIIGPLGPDVCSDDAFVVVPLRGAPGPLHATKRALRATATLYDGRKDTDKLTLRCLPM